jgi:hypothetical protein
MKNLIHLGAILLALCTTTYTQAQDLDGRPVEIQQGDYQPAEIQQGDYQNSGYSQDFQNNGYSQDFQNDGYQQANFQQEGVVEGEQNRPCERPAGECWCKWVKYEPCYSTTYKCCEERIPCTRKCYRRVPCYYQVKCCRMVPQYYCKTCCRYKTECYDVPDCKICKKMVPCRHCKWIPRCYWKKSCEPTCGNGNQGFNGDAGYNVDNSNIDYGTNPPINNGGCSRCAQ